MKKLILLLLLVLIPFSLAMDEFKINADGTTTKTTYNCDIFDVCIPTGSETYSNTQVEQEEVFTINTIDAKTGIFERILTRSILPDFSINYFKFFYMEDLKKKTTHYAMVEQDKLQLEERVASLEGVVTQLLNELCLTQSHTFCDTERINEIVDTYPDFVQPTSTTYYNKGNRVNFNNHIYESLINSNVWSPSAYPAGWKLIL